MLDKSISEIRIKISRLLKFWSHHQMCSLIDLWAFIVDTIFLIYVLGINILFQYIHILLLDTMVFNLKLMSRPEFYLIKPISLMRNCFGIKNENGTP